MQAIDWKAENGTLAVEWIERGGPPVSKPARRGFGTDLIERQLVAALDAKIGFDFEQDGLRFRMTMPLDTVASAH